MYTTSWGTTGFPATTAGRSYSIGNSLRNASALRCKSRPEGPCHVVSRERYGRTVGADVISLREEGAEKRREVTEHVIYVRTAENGYADVGVESVVSGRRHRADSVTISRCTQVLTSGTNRALVVDPPENLCTWIEYGAEPSRRSYWWTELSCRPSGKCLEIIVPGLRCLGLVQCSRWFQHSLGSIQWSWTAGRLSKSL